MPPYLKDLYNGKLNGKTWQMPQVTRNLPNAGGSYQSPVVAPQTPGLFIGPQNKITPPAVVVPPTPAPLVGSFGGTEALPQKYNYNSGVITQAPTGSYTPPVNNLSGIPTKFINPKTGALYSVKEFVDIVANTMPQGDISQFAGDQFTQGPQTKEQLYSTIGGLSSAKGDIETGTTDPYKVATKSGINYSPSELAAIEKAYAGIYDPAINTALAKLDTKKKEEEAAIANKLELEKMALQHKYAMEEKTSGLEGPSSYQEWALAGGKEGTGKTYAEFLSGASTGQSFKSEIATTGRQVVANMLDIGTKNPGIFGRTASMWMPTAARSDAFRNYQAQLDSLKGNIIPAALTAMREASKTGGALGQVSDREGAWLGSSLGALEMSQSPEQVIAQLKQIDAHLAAWQEAVDKYGGGSTGGIIRSPDGTQEVTVSDLTPAELSEAKAAGWK